MTRHHTTFSPIVIGSHVARNRLMRLPTTANLGARNQASEALVAHYRSIAGGGVGTIVTEGFAVHRSSVRGERTIAAFDPDCVPSLRRLTDAAHARGALIFAQLMHGGRQHHSHRGIPSLWAPSAVPCSYSGGVPHAVTEAEIDELIDGFAAAARNCMLGGFDGVELHGAQGYLIQQFLSPASNHRTDGYGGSLDNRMRFAMRILEAVRNVVEKDMVVGFRLGAAEFLDDGLTVEESCEIARVLSETGSIDYLSLSQGTFPTIEMHLLDRHYHAGRFTDLHAMVKRAAGPVPVVTCGRFADPDDIERVLAEGKADIVGMSRSLTADPDWPAKVASEDLDAVIPCIACNRCWQCSMTGEAIRCVVNPAVGREALPRLEGRIGAGRRIVVVGGGPSGMEAARMARSLGASVVLFERGSGTGGQLAQAAAMPHQEELGAFAGYLTEQMVRAGVEIRTGIEADHDRVMAERPDAVVLATGSHPVDPGIENDGSVPIFSDTADGLPDPSPDARILVIDEDGANASAALVEAIAAKGHSVTVSTFQFEPFRELSAVSRIHVLAALDRLGVDYVPYVGPVKVADGAVVVRHKASRRDRRIAGVAAIVWIGRRESSDALATSLRRSGVNVDAIGDAASARRLENAMVEGRGVGAMLLERFPEDAAER